MSESQAPQESQQELRQRFEEARMVGSDLIQITMRREHEGWTPFTCSSEFQPHLSAVSAKKPEDTITESDITAARRSSLAVAVEAAVQVTERKGLVQEDGSIRDSAKRMHELWKGLKSAEAFIIGSLPAEQRTVVSFGRDSLRKRPELFVGYNITMEQFSDQQVLVWVRGTQKAAVEKMDKLTGTMQQIDRPFW